MTHLELNDRELVLAVRLFETTRHLPRERQCVRSDRRSGREARQVLASTTLPEIQGHEAGTVAWGSGFRPSCMGVPGSGSYAVRA
jgi:hypothetical protein